MDADVSGSATCFHIHRLNNQGRMPSTNLRVTASLGSITDTLNYNWGFAYANGFPSWLKITNAHTQPLTFIDLILAVDTLVGRLYGVRTHSGMEKKRKP